MPKGVSQQNQAKKKVSQKGGQSVPVQTTTTSWLGGFFEKFFGNKQTDTTILPAVDTITTAPPVTINSEPVQPTVTQPSNQEGSLLSKFTNVFSSKEKTTEQAPVQSLPNQPQTTGGSKKKQTKQVNRDKKDSKIKNKKQKQRK